MIMIKELKFKVEDGVRIPTQNGKHLMYKGGKFKAVVYANGTGGESCRIHEDYDSEPIGNTWFDDCLFYYVL